MKKLHEIGRLFMVCCLVFVFFAPSAFGRWAKLFGTDQDITGALLPSVAGGYYLTGVTEAETQSSWNISRTDSSGSVTWAKKLPLGVNNFLVALELSDGAFFVQGETTQGTGGGTNALWAKFDASFNPVWQWVFGGDGDEYLAFAPTEDGGFIGGGLSGSYGSGSDMLVIKLNVSGGISWSKVLSIAENDQDFDIQEVSGGYVMSTTLLTETLGVPDGGEDIVLIKLNTSGAVQWGKQYKAGDRSINSAFVSETSDDNLLMAGHTMHYLVWPPTLLSDMLLMKINTSNGSIIWDWKYGDDTYLMSDLVWENADGTFWFFGFKPDVTLPMDTVSVDSGANGNILVLGLNTTGSINSQKLTTNDYIYGSFYKQEDGNYHLRGTQVDTEGAESVVNVLYGKFDSALDPVWVKTFGGDKQDLGALFYTSGQYFLSGTSLSFDSAKSTIFGITLDATGGYPNCQPYFNDFSITWSTPQLTASDLGWAVETVTPDIIPQPYSPESASITVETTTFAIKDICEKSVPIADFSGNPTTGTVPLTVNFTDQSTGSVTSWEWAFGDDNAASTEQNPSHVYNDPGTYTVALTVTGPGGSDTETKNDYILAGQGSLKLTLGPQGAIEADAKWNVDGGEWQGSATTVSGLAVGDHTVRFKDVDDWIPPAMRNVAITDGQITEVKGIFTQETGRLPDTGQTQSYTGTFGEDSDYLINPPSFTKLDGNGNDLPDSAISWAMVRDNVTGLIWEVKTDDGSIHDRDNKYNWQNAQDVFIVAVNAEQFGGHSDWRMPSIKELASITDLGCFNPAINTDYLPNTLSSSYWSSTTLASYADYAWSVNFYYGYDYDYYKSYSYYARAVRGGQVRLLDHLVINGDSTVTDTVAGLMWQQGTDVATNWEAAISHCEALTLAGYEDWRLPNRRELRSIVDYSKYSPAIDTDYFPGTLSSYYWSSTTRAYNTGSAWSVYFRSGHDDYGDKSYSYYARAVRGGQVRLLGHLVISAPAQGSRWDIGSAIPITWETQDIPGHVKISISPQGGKDGTFETISEITENDGTYEWTVTGPVSCNCVLKIEPLDDPPMATTQSLFTIASTVLPTATISGVPDSPTNQADTTLTVGGESIISYKYKLDDEDYGSETLVANPIALTDLTDGSHTVYVLGRDAAGDWQTEPTTATWTVDTVPPTAIISGTPSSPTNQTEATLIVSGEGVTHYKYKLDSGTYGDEITVIEPISLSGLTDGSHTLYVIGRDLAGNWQTEATTATWIVDTIPPTATISGVPPNPTNQTGATLTVGGEGVTYYKYKVETDIQGMLGNGGYSEEIPLTTDISLTGLTDGSHTVYVIGRDTAENWQSEASPTTASWTVDTVAPIVTGLSDDPTPTQSKTWTWEADKAATFRYAIDRNTTWSPRGEFTDTTTATKSDGDGIWYIHVQAKDLAGNNSAVTTVSAVLDNTAPTATMSGIPDSPTNQTAATITVGGEGVTHYKYKLDDGAYGGETAVSEPISLSGLADGSHTLCVIGRDSAGNWQSEGSPTNGSWVVDTACPVITGLSDDPLPTQEKSWAWDATDATAVMFRYLIDQNEIWENPSGDYSDVNTATKSGVSGTWYLHVQAKDAAQNESDVGTVSAVFYTSPTPATDSATSVSLGSAILNGIVNPNGASTTVVFEYGLTTSYGNTITATQSPVTGITAQMVSAQISGLDAGSTYHFRVMATNSAGTIYGNDQSFTVSADPPTVNTCSPTSVRSDSATINGSVNPNGLATTYYFEYGTTPHYGLITGPRSAGSGWSDTRVDAYITGLSPSTTYHYRVVATNTAGTSDGSDMIFTTSIIYVAPDGGCNGNNPCYSSIQDAIDSAYDGAFINVEQGIYEEDIILDAPKDLILLGGWDSTFTSQTSYTTANGLIIRQGKIITYNLVLKPLIEASSGGVAR